MKKVDDFCLRFGKQELVPIMTGGMGVDISTAELALVAARLGGVGHISDAMVPTVSDRRFDTGFVAEKLKLYKYNVASSDKSPVQFNLGRLAEATQLHIGRTMEAKKGSGLIFINCMEKLTMGMPRDTLRVRLSSALDAGIDGITLSAGLHLGSLALVQDHPRFRDAKFGIIVSSLRALQLFLRKNARLNRLPDYVIVEGPLAGGHLGFGMDWAQYDLKTIVTEIHQYFATEGLTIPLIPAGGIFTGSDAVEFLEAGAAAVQLATRFTVTHECGLPAEVKQEYFKANEEDVEVNMISPTGYPMRMLKKVRVSAMASVRTVRPMATCSMAQAIAPTSTPTTARWRRIRARRRFRSRTRPACVPRCVTSTSGPAATTPTASRTPAGASRTAAMRCSAPSTYSAIISSAPSTASHCRLTNV